MNTALHPSNDPFAAARGVIPVQLLLATSAKVLCSALFVSEREEAEAWRNSVFHALQMHHLPDILPELVEADVDSARRRVTLHLQANARAVARLVEVYRATYPDLEADWDAEALRLRNLGRIERSARFVGSQGSVILPLDGSDLRFEPLQLKTTLPDGAHLRWPMGDECPGGVGRSRIDRNEVRAAIDAAFDDPRGQTAAVVVVHHGEIVGERYRDGMGMQNQLESWSMGKSITATLIGVLVHAGLLSLDDPVPVPAWQGEGDPRAGITLRHLLQMSSGLRCSGHTDPRAQWRFSLPDHFMVYGEALDAFAFALDRPSEFAPGTIGRYRNCDPLALGWLIRETVVRRLGENYLAWPQKALFDAIGIRSQILETDLHGNFVMTGFNYGAPRNWARLGLLYLNDGVFEGQRLLPKGWSTFVSTPAPAWADARYGGQFWLNRDGEFALPRDAYSMAGAGDQRVFIVPSADLVVVRMGHQAAYATARASVNQMLGTISRAEEATR